jgi:hypothetical protein
MLLTILFIYLWLFSKVFEKNFQKEFAKNKTSGANVIQNVKYIKSNSYA